MSARYTSPELSKALADAGLEQHADVQFGVMAYCHGLGDVHEQNADCEKPIHRALDLTDVLEELTREREGGALARPYALELTVYRQDLYSFGDPDRGPYCSAALSPVEAAGLVLLALLKERA